jgi:CBS domain-containing protein
VANPIDLEKIGEFSEGGRGVPVQASRPAGALPFSPLVRQAFAPTPRVRLGWAAGELMVHEVHLEPARAVGPDSTIADAARLMREDGSDLVPVVADGHFRGILHIDDVLKLVADNQTSSKLQHLVSSQIPTCSPRSALVDAVRQMVACYLRRIPVVGDDGALLGMLTLSTAAQESERDPAVRDLLESATPSFFARRWR